MFDFFLVPPHLTFAVSDTQYVVTFAVMLVVGLLVSRLAARVREVAEMALQRETRTRALYAVSRELGGLRDPREVAAAGARHVALVLHGEAAVLLAPTPRPRAGRRAAAGVRHGPARDRRSRSGRSSTAGPPERRPTRCPRRARLYEPIEGSRSRLGRAGARAARGGPARSPPSSATLVSALARLIAAPLERAQLAAEAERARVAAESERLRSTLLSSVSHDLRTPLAAITGAASALLEEPPPAAAVARELTSTVLDEAERLNRLVGNLLDMTRLESGTLEPRREWHSLEELVGSALARVERQAGARRHRGARRPRPAARRRRRRAGRAGARQPARERAAPRRARAGSRSSARREGEQRRGRGVRRGPRLPGATRRSASSTSSTARPAGRAPGSASRSRARSSPPTGARSRPRCGSPAARASASSCRSGAAPSRPAPGGVRVSAETRGDGRDASRWCSSSRTSRSSCASCARRCRRTASAWSRPATGERALVEAQTRAPDLVLLDLGLPDLDGVEVVRRIRAWSAVPIVVVSARGQETDKVEALDAGADDYLTKPFGTGELLARMRVALRHALARRRARESRWSRRAACAIDLGARASCTAAARRCASRGPSTACSPSSPQHAGKVLTHRHLLREVWGPGAASETHYLRVYMAQLRHKLEDDPARPRHLLTETGVGYRLKVDP